MEYGSGDRPWRRFVLHALIISAAVYFTLVVFGVRRRNSCVSGHTIKRKGYQIRRRAGWIHEASSNQYSINSDPNSVEDLTDKRNGLAVGSTTTYARENHMSSQDEKLAMHMDYGYT